MTAAIMVDMRRRAGSYQSSDVSAGEEVGLEHGVVLDEVEEEQQHSANAAAVLEAHAYLIEELWKGNGNNALACTRGVLTCSQGEKEWILSLFHRLLVTQEEKEETAPLAECERATAWAFGEQL